MKENVNPSIWKDILLILCFILIIVGLFNHFKPTTQPQNNVYKADTSALYIKAETVNFTKKLIRENDSLKHLLIELKSNRIIEKPIYEKKIASIRKAPFSSDALWLDTAFTCNNSLDSSVLVPGCKIKLIRLATAECLEQKNENEFLTATINDQERIIINDEKIINRLDSTNKILAIDIKLKANLIESTSNKNIELTNENSQLKKQRLYYFGLGALVGFLGSILSR